MRFAEVANRVPVTMVVLLAYATLALVTGLEPTNAKLLRYGAAVGLLVQDGEAWRLLTYAFLHGGILHLLCNGYFLYAVGPTIELALGSPRFALVYAVGALGGGIGGCLWQAPNVPLVGGSGALFGLMGAALALVMRRGRSPLDFLNYVGPRQLLSVVLINLALGLMWPQVSNAAHIGGLVAGFALTFCFLVRGRDRPDRWSRAIQAGWIALAAALLFYCMRPVVRWDYLVTQCERDGDPERCRALARALLLRYDLRDLPPAANAWLRDAAAGK